MRIMHRLRTTALLVLLAAIASPLAAQKKDAAKEPKRPKLAAGVDTNDARAYHEYGIAPKTSWKDAYNAFYWAYRLEPDQPAYLYAQYLALWGRQPYEWKTEYFDGADFVVKSKEAALIDSVYYQAVIRDPYVHLYGDRCIISQWVDEVPDMLAADLLESGNCYKQAAERYTKVLAKNPKHTNALYYRSRARYFVSDFAGAAQDAQALVKILQERDAKKLRAIYQTKTMFEYMTGWAYMRMGDYAQAREAFGRALTEDLSFFMAKSALARVALAQGDVPTAIAELEQAVQLKEDDAQLRLEYGVALLQALPPRGADAEVQFRKAIELQPWFSLAYYNLGQALDAQEKRAEALAVYQQYLARSPKRALALNVKAGQRVKALLAAGVAPASTTVGSLP